MLLYCNLTRLDFHSDNFRSSILGPASNARNLCTFCRLKTDDLNLLLAFWAETPSSYMKPMRQEEFEGLLRSNLRFSLSDQGVLKCSRLRLFRTGDCSKYEKTKTKTCFLVGVLSRLFPGMSLQKWCLLRFGAHGVPEKIELLRDPSIVESQGWFVEIYGTSKPSWNSLVENSKSDSAWVAGSSTWIHVVQLVHL